MATFQSISAPCALPVASFDLLSQIDKSHSETYPRPRTECAKDDVLAGYPMAFVKPASEGQGFIIWVCDYAAGYGLTLEAAWTDALHVLTNDLLSHDRLADGAIKSAHTNEPLPPLA
jgi:hypothetical protein